MFLSIHVKAVPLANFKFKKAKDMKVRDAAEKELFVGIDMHKRSWKIHTATDMFSGKRLTMPAGPLKLKQWVDKFYPDHKVSCAYEAGCCGYSAHRAFQAFGWRSIVFNPADISRTGKAQYQKTDRIDAQLICRELKDGRLHGITVPDPEREQLRSLFRSRNNLVKDLRRVKSRIKSQLLFMGIEVPEELDNSNWSKAFLKWVSSQEFEYSPGKDSLQILLRQYSFADEQVRDASNQLRAWCRKHHKVDYGLLRSIPGIGGITACCILSEMGDLRRFDNFRQLSAYVGLIPGVSESGEKSASSRMNPRGNRIMRSAFVEAAWQSLRFDPVMQQYYRDHVGKDSKAVIVKVANKLLRRTLAVIKTGIPYQPGVIQ